MEQALLFARNNLLSYAILQYAQYKPANHHRLIARALERVVKGECKRLIITLPPRHGKSMLISEFFPAWYLGHHPEHSVIFSTYAQEFADDFGRKVRNQLQSPIYQATFPECKISSDSASAQKFNTDQKGAYFAVGMGGPITGRGAHCVVSYCAIDTPNGRIQSPKLKVGDLVYGYDHQSGRIVETRIRAISVSRKGKPEVDICGARLTADHLVYTDKGYVEAGVSEGLSYLRIKEGTTCFDMQSLPIRREEDGKFDMHSLCKGFSEKIERTSKISRQIWGIGKSILFQKLLRQVQNKAPNNIQQAKRQLLTVWECFNSKQARKVLFVQLLQRIQSKIEKYRKICFGLYGYKITYSEQGQGLFSMRFQDESNGRASYRPQSRKQWNEQSGIDMLGLSQKISCVYGESAENLAGFLQDDHYLVDFQTDTSNFFANGILVHNCLILDDVIKGREEAESETFRRKMKEWYQSVARTRLMPGGSIVTVHTRWHEDDLIGWLMAAHSHEKWEIINLPAIDEEGKPLWPEMYDAKTLESIRDAVGLRDWNALYQQNPIPDAGDFFKREWFKFEDTPPTGMYIYGASDFAVTEGRGDFTEHGIFGIDSENNIHILDWWSGQTNSAEWINAMLDLADQWQPMRWFGEAGVIRRAVEPQLAKRMEERSIYLNMEWMASMSDKSTRAVNFQGRAANGKVFLPRKSQWASELLNQLVRFPAGLHDDKVDVCSLIGRGLQYQSAPTNMRVSNIDAYREKRKKRTRSAWSA